MSPKYLKRLLIVAVILLVSFITAQLTLEIGWHEYYQENGVRVVEQGFPLPNTKVGFINGEEYKTHPNSYIVTGLHARELNTLIYSFIYAILTFLYGRLRKVRNRQ